MKEYGVGGRLQCLRCGHTWHARSERRPVQCPRCKSTSWDSGGRLAEAAVQYATRSDTMADTTMTGAGLLNREELRSIQMMTDWSDLIDAAGWGDAEKSVDEMLAEIRSGWRVLDVLGEDEAGEISD